MRFPAHFALVLFCGCSLSTAADAGKGASAVLWKRTEDQYGKKGEVEREDENAREPHSRFNEAELAAAGALQEIEELRRSFERNTTKDAVDKRVREIAKRAEEAINERRNELVQQFEGNVSLAQRALAEADANKMVATAAAKAARRRARAAAKDALSSMRRLDVQLERTERQHVGAVRRHSDELARAARKQARRVENEGGHLLRLVRHECDHVDQLARNEGKGSNADQLERNAEDALRALDDELEEGSRRVDDRVRELADHISDDLHAKVQTHQDARNSNISAVAESLLAVSWQDQQLVETSTTMIAATAAFVGALVGGLAVVLAVGESQPVFAS